VIYLGGPKPQEAKEGTDPEWPAGDGKRVFALVRSTRAAERILEGLKASGQRVLAMVPRLPKEVADKFAGSNVKLAEGKFDVARAIANADAVVMHGAHGSIIGALRHGKPVLVLPLNTEHRLVGARVIEQGVGLMPDQLEDGTIAELLGRLTSDPSFTKNAADFAERVAKPPKQNPAALFLSALGPVPKKQPGAQQQGKGAPARGGQARGGQARPGQARPGQARPAQAPQRKK
jgi:UDP:flavonoid glycosyltransferase YjiC (YdhE family)